MKTPVDNNIYYAKATWPIGNSWRSGWTNKAKAEQQAEKFVEDWRQCGIAAKAAVFYRDGNMVCEKQ